MGNFILFFLLPFYNALYSLDFQGASVLFIFNIRWFEVIKNIPVYNVAYILFYYYYRYNSMTG